MAAKNRKPRKTVIFTVYLYRQCPRAHQDGVIYMKEPPNKSGERQFNYLDSIPRQIRKLLESAGLTYDVHNDCDDTVITEKKRKRKVIRKVRAGDK
jgi:hypothetical protein